jgi:diguanylate cyclase (GGDEF)-like protein
MTEDDLPEAADDPRRDPEVLGAKLRRTQRLLRRQSARFTAALENMPHGFSMFDARAHLVACNQTYLDIYRLDRATARPGTSFQRILEARVAANTHAGDDAASYVSERIVLQSATEPQRGTVRLNSGRVVLVAHIPIADGGWVSTHQDITEFDQAQKELKRLAYHDPLTGAANRHLFQETVQAALESHAAFAVLCLDLDGFKAVNDTLGHSGGDRLLCEAVERLHGLVPTGLVARMGGDEFAVFLPEADDGAALALAGHIIEGFGQPFLTAEGEPMRVAASLGIALAPAHGEDIDTLLAAADRALYTAKRAGKGSVQLFVRSLDQEAREREQLENDLRQALELGQFELDYQPILDLTRQCFCGFEALLRWRHPTRGLISPAVFIPIAEETGLIGPIGEWVIREAFETAARWPEAYRVAVNVSTEQFRPGNLVGMLIHALAITGLEASRVEIEITESLLLEEHETNLETLRQMHRLGLRIAMDDFGTGYSSLSYLLAFPFDKIKIDGSFIRGLDGMGAAHAIVHAVADIGRRLGLTVTAEGVETPEQLRNVHALGYGEAQGYLLARPMSRAAVDALLGLDEAAPDLEHLAPQALQASG